MIGAVRCPSRQHGMVGIRPLRMRDAAAWSECRVRNERWLAAWDGRPPGTPAAGWADRHTPAVFTATLRVLRREARAGRSLPFAITHDGRFAGQVTVSNLVRGAFASGSVGYWVDEQVAGRGVAPTALALVIDHCFAEAGLHRVEADVRPENLKSIRVMEKLGFAREGLHRRMLFIDGDWRDHVSWALLAEDVPAGLPGLLAAAAGDTPPEVHRRRPDSHYGQRPWVAG